MKLPMLCNDCSRPWTQQEFSNACVESLYPLICEQCMRHQGTVDEAYIVEDASIITPTDNDVDTYSDKVKEKQETVTLTGSTTSDKTVKLGEAIRDEFLLHDGSTFLNHGSYGAVPRRVHEYKTRLQQQMELHPKKWFEVDSPKLLKQAIETVSAFLGTHPVDTYLVQNVTKGCNTVIKSFPLKSDDAILINNLTYPAVANTAMHTAATCGAAVLIVDITFPIASEDDILDKYEQVLQENPNIRLAVLDHITSSTALLMPVERLTKMCHRYDVIVLIDGAHAPGQLKLNLADVDADFYTGNFHKWGFSARSCAVLWQNPLRSHGWFRPLVTSCEHGTTLQEEFGYEGIKDDSSYYSVVEGIKFIQTVGGLETISRYNKDLLQAAFTYLSTIWDTCTVDVPDCMAAPFMKLLQLPELKDFQKTTKDAERLQQFMLDHHNIDCKLYCRDQRLFYRLSVQIYNCMDDFRKLERAVKELRA